MSAAPKGFTLVELLVAISLFSLIALLLFSGFRFADRGWEVSKSQLAEIEQVRGLHQFLQQYLQSSYPLSIQVDRQRQLVFEGDSQQLGFVANMPAHLGPPGLYRLQIEIEEEAEKKALNLTRQLMHPDYEATGNDGLNKESTLIDNLEDIEFAYIAANSINQQQEWLSHWDNPSSVPALVRVRLSLATSKTEFFIKPLATRATATILAR